MPSQSVATNACTASSCARSTWASSSPGGGTTSSEPPSSYFEASRTSPPCATPPGRAARPRVSGCRLAARPRSPFPGRTPRRAPCRRAAARAPPPRRAPPPNAPSRCPTDEPSRAGLTKPGTRTDCRRCVVRAQRDVLRHGDLLGAHDLLEDVLVHAERRREDAWADVRHACELEQALHRAVLAERPVQDGQDDVDLLEHHRGCRICNDRAVFRQTSPPSGSDSAEA